MMRKYLMTAMAVVTLGGVFSGCGNDVDLSGGSTAEFNIVQNYENAFITRFGQPDSAQTWGFGEPSASTRAVVDRPYISDGGYTYNAQMAMAWEGVDAAIASGTPQSSFDFMNAYAVWHGSGWKDKYMDVHGTVVASELSDEFVAAARQVIVGTGEQPGLIPENGNNLAKAQSTGYSIVTTGGPVTLTPIYHYSNSGDRLSYYYYPVGQKPSAEQIKMMPKYSLGEMSNPSQGGDTHLYNNTYSLVYVDANGSCSYEFPANYVINFVISNTWGGASNQIYQSGGVTTTTEVSTLTSQGKYALSNGETIQSGTERDVINGKVRIKFGKTTPQFTQAQGSVTISSWLGWLYNKTFTGYVAGNGVNGSLDAGSTCYYFKVNDYGTLRIGVKQNGGEIKVYQVGSDWDGTSNKNITATVVENECRFSVGPNNVYAVYSEGGQLGCFGYVLVNWYNNDIEYNALNGGPYDCGTIINGPNNKIDVKLGKVPTFTTTAGDNSLSADYPYYTPGNGNNGGFSTNATTYFLKPTEAGKLRVAVRLNGNKTIKVVDLGVDGWNNTSGTEILSDTKSSTYNGTYDFDVEANHVYAVYAQGSKLGFYGCEFLKNVSTAGPSSTSNIEKKTISTKPDYYSDSSLNAEIHSTTFGYGVGEYGVTDPNTSHTAVFQGKVGDEDITFVGFEDWVDFDFNDLVFAVTGTKTETPQEPIVIPDPDDPDEPTDPGTFVCRIIAEDLTVGENSDFDFNDVVFDVFCDGSKTTIRLRAAGGELPLYVAGHEVHQEFGYSGSYPIINTGWDGEIDYEGRYADFTIDVVYNTRTAANNIPVVVTKRGENKELTDILLTARTGKVASKVCVGRDYEWCSERLDVDNKFHKQDGTKLFQQYVVGNFGDDWDAGTAWYQFRGK